MGAPFFVFGDGDLWLRILALPLGNLEFENWRRLVFCDW